MNITPDQIRAARALLKWGQNDLAERSGVSVPAIANIETERQKPNVQTMQKLMEAFHLDGIEFIDGGVRRVRNLVQVLQGVDANRRLLDSVYETLRQTGGETLIAGVSEPDKIGSKEHDFIKFHVDRLEKANIGERILLKEGDTNFLAKPECYRWLPKEYFSPHTFQLFGDRLAMISWGPPLEILVIHSPYFAESFRNFFNFAWNHAKIVPGAKA